MCKKTQFKYCPSTIDSCMTELILTLRYYGVPTVACCCGHGKYPMTIVIGASRESFKDLISNKEIPRKKRFYKKDKQGYYYIPEVIKNEPK